jgi:hypothetical protein
MRHDEPRLVRTSICTSGTSEGGVGPVRNPVNTRKGNLVIFSLWRCLRGDVVIKFLTTTGCACFP